MTEAVTITKEENLEFAQAVTQEESFNAWLETGENRNNLRLHIMKLAEEVGNAGVRMGADRVFLELAKAGLIEGVPAAPDADDEIPANRTLN